MEQRIWVVLWIHFHFHFHGCATKNKSLFIFYYHMQSNSFSFNEHNMAFVETILYATNAKSWRQTNVLYSKSKWRNKWYLVMEFITLKKKGKAWMTHLEPLNWPSTHQLPRHHHRVTMIFIPNHAIQEFPRPSSSQFIKDTNIDSLIGIDCFRPIGIHWCEFLFMTKLVSELMRLNWYSLENTIKNQCMMLLMSVNWKRFTIRNEPVCLYWLIYKWFCWDAHGSVHPIDGMMMTMVNHQFKLIGNSWGVRLWIRMYWLNEISR